MSAPSHTIESGIRFGIVLEHRALRDEILKRIEMRQQIVAVALTLAGVFRGRLNARSSNAYLPTACSSLGFGLGSK